jgi:integrase
MSEYRLQRFRGGWAIARYLDGKRVERRQLAATSSGAAASEFNRIVAEVSRPERITIEAIWDAYRTDRDGRPIAKTMGFERKAVLAHFGDMSPDDITDESCRAYARRRRSVGRQDGTIWTELGHLRTALKWAERTKRIARAPHIERPQKPAAKERYLTREEAERLLDATGMPHVRLFVILAITTAARASALLDLTWDRCDMERRLIYLGDPDAKGRRKGRATVPMNDTARAALAEARTGARSSFVIEWAGGKVGKVRKGIDSAARRAGLDDVSPHVLRHTAAVWMAESGTPMSEIAQYLGHTSTAVTERVYARFSPDYLRGAASSLEFGKMRSAPGFSGTPGRAASARKAS